MQKNTKNKFEKNFFKLMNNSVYGKTMENVRNHRDNKLVKSDKRRKRLVSEPNYHSHKKFSEYLMVIEMKKTKTKMIKPIYLGMSILDIMSIMYGFWFDYIKSKYGDKAKLCYANTDSFVIYIKTEDFFVDIAGDVVALRPKTWAYLIDGYDDDDYEKNKIINKKAKGVKKAVIKNKLMFENFKYCLFKGKIILKSQQTFRSELHNVHTLEINKVVLSGNDNNR